MSKSTAYAACGPPGLVGVLAPVTVGLSLSLTACAGMNAMKVHDSDESYLPENDEEHFEDEWHS